MQAQSFNMSLNQLSREAIVKGLHQRTVRPFAARFFHASTAVQADDQIECKVNGESVHVPKGSTVMQACDAAGIDIPRCKPVIRQSVCLQLQLLKSLGHGPGAAGEMPFFLQVLLSSEAVHSWQLQNVFGRGIFATCTFS